MNNKNVILILLSLSISFGGCESNSTDSKLIGRKYEPPEIVYKPASQEMIQNAENALRSILSSGDLSATVEALPTPFVICGTSLWLRICNQPEISKIEAETVRVSHPIVKNGVIIKIQKIDVKMLQSKKDIYSFLNVLKRDVIQDSEYNIRQPNQEEKETYWSLVPYGSIYEPIFIDEPILIAESVDYKLLIHMLVRDGIYYPFWLDDIKNVK